MQLEQLAVQPKLTKLTISEPKIVEKYGEELEFYVYDRQKLDVFAKMASITEDNAMQYSTLLTDLILNDKGEPVMTEDKILPIDVLTEAIKLIGDMLGK
tara:strand:+ start:1834 stop:2130 length:297 start_codon:yes stop_codon:yes gene_type:complete